MPLYKLLVYALMWFGLWHLKLGCHHEVHLPYTDCCKHTNECLCVFVGGWVWVWVLVCVLQETCL